MPWYAWKALSSSSLGAICASNMRSVSNRQAGPCMQALYGVTEKLDQSWLLRRYRQTCDSQNRIDAEASSLEPCYSMATKACLQTPTLHTAVLIHFSQVDPICAGAARTAESGATAGDGRPAAGGRGAPGRGPCQRPLLCGCLEGCP